MVELRQVLGNKEVGRLLSGSTRFRPNEKAVTNTEYPSDRHHCSEGTTRKICRYLSASGNLYLAVELSRKGC